MSAPLIPVHPEATADDDALRWVFPVGTLDFVGVPAGLPEPLQALYDDGTLTPPLLVEPAAARLRIAAGRDWRSEGPRVRRALQAALAHPRQWQPPVASSPDDVLLAAVEEVLAGEVGDFVRGHGGEIRVLGAADDVVTVALGGTCAGCPASGLTLQHRLEVALRRCYPQLRGVIAHEEAPSHRPSRLLKLWPSSR